MSETDKKFKINYICIIIKFYGRTNEDCYNILKEFNVNIIFHKQKIKDKRWKQKAL